MNQAAAIRHAFILHKSPYRETSYLATLLTEDEGVMNVIIKGAMRPKSPFRGMVESFMRLSVEWVGRGDLKTLTQLELDDTWQPLRGTALMAGLYMNELTVKLLPKHIPVHVFFQAYYAALLDLRTHDAIAKSLRRFELALLDALGYDVDFHDDVDSHYAFGFDVGWVRCSPDAPGATSGECLQALQQDMLTDAQATGEARRLLQSLIHTLLRGKGLASPQLIRGAS